MDGREHGGYQAEGGARRVLDFSASVSPLGVPWGIRRAIARAAGRADAYPDPLCRRLRAAIAAAEQDAWPKDTSGAAGAKDAGTGTGGAAPVPPEWVLCGSGAADLIYRAARAVRPARAVLPAPTFSEYESALRDAGCGDIVRVPLLAERGFQPEYSFFHRFMTALTPVRGAGPVSDRTGSPVPDQADGQGIAFLCQPNNPTGISIPRPLLLQILERCREAGYTLALDECFLPFLDRPEDFTLSDCLEDYPNLLILRSFTKLYGCAGVRLGYVLSSSGGLLDRMARSGPPWAVSTLAQEAGLAALRERGYVQQVRRLIGRERPRLRAGLDALGLRTIPGEANFLLFRAPCPLDAPLLERGVVVRNCENFPGLGESWYRTAVRTGPENRRLLGALEEVLKQETHRRI
ncbi:MAG: aminotransferase class I/II-fold pyridoxal phosphate-dependent enzyme [Oscillibacter sp.]|nr:aminotransferase class I/II-fold pyridoxal phosphate-dependent enzyme [Oscillibacter sp.]